MILAGSEPGVVIMSKRVSRGTERAESRATAAIEAIPSAALARQGNSLASRSVRPLTNAERASMIAEAAYYLAQQRGFEAGHELEDWLLAEGQIDAALAIGALVVAPTTAP